MDIRTDGQRMDGHRKKWMNIWIDGPGNTKGGNITVPLTSRLTGLD